VAAEAAEALAQWVKIQYREPQEAAEMASSLASQAQPFIAPEAEEVVLETTLPPEQVDLAGEETDQTAELGKAARLTQVGVAGAQHIPLTQVFPGLAAQA